MKWVEFLEGFSLGPLTFLTFYFHSSWLPGVWRPRAFMMLRAPCAHLGLSSCLSSALLPKHADSDLCLKWLTVVEDLICSSVAGVSRWSAAARRYRAPAFRQHEGAVSWRGGTSTVTWLDCPQRLTVVSCFPLPGQDGNTFRKILNSLILS